MPDETSSASYVTELKSLPDQIAEAIRESIVERIGLWCRFLCILAASGNVSLTKRRKLPVAFVATTNGRWSLPCVACVPPHGRRASIGRNDCRISRALFSLTARSATRRRSPVAP